MMEGGLARDPIVWGRSESLETKIWESREKKDQRRKKKKKRKE